MTRTDIGQDGVAKSRKLEKVELKINKAFLDLKFNHSCKSENLILTSLKFFPPVRSSRGFKLAKKFSIQFLKLRITELHQKIRNLQMEKEKLEIELQTKLDVYIYTSFSLNTFKSQKLTKSNKSALHTKRS